MKENIKVTKSKKKNKIDDIFRVTNANEKLEANHFNNINNMQQFNNVNSFNNLNNFNGLNNLNQLNNLNNMNNISNLNLNSLPNNPYDLSNINNLANIGGALGGDEAITDLITLSNQNQNNKGKDGVSPLPLDNNLLSLPIISNLGAFNNLMALTSNLNNNEILNLLNSNEGNQQIMDNIINMMSSSNNNTNELELMNNCLMNNLINSNSIDSDLHNLLHQANQNQPNNADFNNPFLALLTSDINRNPANFPNINQLLANNTLSSHAEREIINSLLHDSVANEHQLNTNSSGFFNLLKKNTMEELEKTFNTAYNPEIGDKLEGDGMSQGQNTTENHHNTNDTNLNNNALENKSNVIDYNYLDNLNLMLNKYKKGTVESGNPREDQNQPNINHHQSQNNENEKTHQEEVIEEEENENNFNANDSNTKEKIEYSDRFQKNEENEEVNPKQEVSENNDLIPLPQTQINNNTEHEVNDNTSCNNVTKITNVNDLNIFNNIVMMEVLA